MSLPSCKPIRHSFLSLPDTVHTQSCRHEWSKEGARNSLKKKEASLLWNNNFCSYYFLSPWRENNFQINFLSKEHITVARSEQIQSNTTQSWLQAPHKFLSFSPIHTRTLWRFRECVQEYQEKAECQNRAMLIARATIFVRSFFS